VVSPEASALTILATSSTAAFSQNCLHQIKAKINAVQNERSRLVILKFWIFTIFFTSKFQQRQTSTVGHMTNEMKHDSSCDIQIWCRSVTMSTFRLGSSCWAVYFECHTHNHASSRPRRTHIIDLYKSYSTLPIDLPHKYQILLFVHKFAHHSNRLPVIFASYFTQNKLVNHHDTRDKCDFHLSTPCTTFGKRSLKYKGSHLWNRLPESTKLIQSTPVFKSSLMVFLLTTVWTGITDLCTFVPLAPCTLHFAVNWFCYCFLLQWVAS